VPATETEGSEGSIIYCYSSNLNIQAFVYDLLKDTHYNYYLLMEIGSNEHPFK
jgi:hypothetical protein